MLPNNEIIILQPNIKYHSFDDFLNICEMQRRIKQKKNNIAGRKFSVTKDELVLYQKSFLLKCLAEKFLLPKVFSVSSFSKSKTQNHSLEDPVDICAMKRIFPLKYEIDKIDKEKYSWQKTFCY